MGKAQNHYGLVWTNTEHKVLFLHIPKNATCSIRNLGRNYNNSSGPRYFNKTTTQSLGDGLNEYFIFTVLRNPYERFKSGYLTAMSVNAGYHDWLDESKFKLMIEMLSVDGESVDVHLTPQSYFIKNVKVDKFIQFENIREGLKYVTEQTDFSQLSEVQHYNKAGYLNPKYGTESKEKLESLIQKMGYEDVINKIYQQDWDLYNKEFS